MKAPTAALTALFLMTHAMPSSAAIGPFHFRWLAEQTSAACRPAGKLISQLANEDYNRALSVHVPPLEAYDHRAELRKIRLLLESLL